MNLINEHRVCQDWSTYRHLERLYIYIYTKIKLTNC